MVCHEIMSCLVQKTKQKGGGGGGGGAEKKENEKEGEEEVAYVVREFRKSPEYCRRYSLSCIVHTTRPFNRHSRRLAFRTENKVNGAFQKKVKSFCFVSVKTCFEKVTSFK